MPLDDSNSAKPRSADLRAIPSVLETVFDAPKKLAAALAESLAEDLKRAVEERGEASLVVSGGSTPLPLFAALSHAALPWQNVWITLADERWVDPSDSASNEKLVRTHLLQNAAAAARFVGMKTDADTPEAGEAECQERIAEMPRPFDVVVLGMGGDGHTASLFPDAPQLSQALDLSTDKTCLAMRPPSAANPRMTLTLAALVDSRRTIIHITGDEKWDVYRRALAPGPVEELPIRAILNRGPEPIDVYWSP